MCNKGEQHYRSSPSNQSSSSDPGPCGSGTWSQHDGCPSSVLHECSRELQGGDREGYRDTLREPTLERTLSTEAKWHIPSTKILNSRKQREGGKESPNKLNRGGEKMSRQSSSNTLSSNASSNNSDDKHFGSGDLMDPEILGLTYIKGASTDSGIDTNPCMGPGGRLLLQGGCGGEGGHPKDGGEGEDHGKLYLPQGYASAIMTGHVTEGSIGDLSEISSHSHSSHSSGSHHSGSPLARGARYCVSADSSRVYTFPQTSSGAGPEGSGQTRPLPGSEHLKKTEDSSTNEEPKHSECGQLYLQEAAERAREAKALDKLSKEEYLKMMLEESGPVEDGRRKESGPEEDGRRKVRWFTCCYLSHQHTPGGEWSCGGRTEEGEMVYLLLPVTPTHTWREESGPVEDGRRKGGEWSCGGRTEEGEMVYLLLPVTPTHTWRRVVLWRTDGGKVRWFTCCYLSHQHTPGGEWSCGGRTEEGEMVYLLLPVTPTHTWRRVVLWRTDGGSEMVYLLLPVTPTHTWRRVVLWRTNGGR
ncbi:unnamed protein product [Coregonus sp. 'balchen']|nr:unnamed protein product [Coregonus sp. 'balchen']